MKLSALFVTWIAISVSAFASLSESKKTERPAVSLEEAVRVTKAILRVQGEERKYYVIQAELFGGDRDEGARWIIILESAETSGAHVHIMTKSPDCFISYHSQDPAVHDAGRKVHFSRDAAGSVKVVKD